MNIEDLILFKWCEDTQTWFYRKPGEPPSEARKETIIEELGLRGFDGYLPLKKTGDKESLRQIDDIVISCFEKGWSGMLAYDLSYAELFEHRYGDLSLGDYMEKLESTFELEITTRWKKNQIEFRFMDESSIVLEFQSFVAQRTVHSCNEYTYEIVIPHHLVHPGTIERITANIVQCFLLHEFRNSRYTLVLKDAHKVEIYFDSPMSNVDILAGRMVEGTSLAKDAISMCPRGKTEIF